MNYRRIKQYWNVKVDLEGKRLFFLTGNYATSFDYFLLQSMGTKIAWQSRYDGFCYTIFASNTVPSKPTKYFLSKKSRCD